MDVLIAGGGTGGHLFPGIALAQELRRRDAEARIVFVGTARGIEMHAVPRAGFALELLPVSGLRRVGGIGVLRSLLKLPLALFRALAVVRRHRPDVAISVGGYAAGPAVLAARIFGVRCVIMEQNAIPGLTNRILGWLAHEVFAALPVQGFAARKVRIVGNPVRADLLAVRDAPYEPKRRLLVFGGSQGARALNTFMIDHAATLVDAGVSIVHQTGAADVERVRAAYVEERLDITVLPFIDDMASAYRDADVVLCRSGASTVAELTVCGRPAVLVPFPYAVDDHQTRNARVLAEGGAALCIAEGDIGAALVPALRQLFGDAVRLRQMAARSRALGHPEAAQAIADALEAVHV